MKLNVQLHKSQSAKSLVGSIHSGSLNYHQDTHAFDSLAIPSKVKQAVAEIRQMTSADILGLSAPSWNKSTSISRNQDYSEQLVRARKNFEIRMGFQDRKILQYRPNKIFAGTETRNQFTNWNVSTYIEKCEHDKQLKELTKIAQESTSKVNLKLKGYISPDIAQEKLMEKIRLDKVNDQELRDKIREQYLYESPKASEAKTAANVFKRVAAHKLKAKQGALASLNTDESFTPQLSENLRWKISKKRIHDGIWEYNEQMAKNVWSCCMNEILESDGCILKSRNLDRWILTSI